MKAIINNYFDTDSYQMDIGDLLYELEIQEVYIEDDLVDLQRLGRVDIEDDIITLDGKASSLIKLAENIVEEMVAADEYDGNEDEAKQIFYSLVFEL